MKTSIPSSAKSTTHVPEKSRVSCSGAHSGHLAQLASMMNQSPRVQAQLKLADEIQNSERIQNQLALADGINQTQLSVAQPRFREEEEPAQREEAPAPNRTGLPGQLKFGVESLSGISLDDVKVHYNSAKPAQLNALAYAQGTDIHVASGQEKHLPHEAWHIVQQKQGRVRPTLQMKQGIPVNNDRTLEREADTMGAQALRLTHADSAMLHAGDSSSVALPLQKRDVVQRQEGEDTPEPEVNPGAELEKTISALKQLLESTEDSETASDMEAYITELEEIAESGDADLQALALESLDEEARTRGISSIKQLPEPGGSEEPGNGREVLQGNFIYDFLSQIISLAVENRYAVAAVVILAAALVKIRAERKRKRLPLKPSADLFAANRLQYWVYLSRFLETYCETNGVSANDQKLLKETMLAAIKSSVNEKTFKKYEYVGQAAGKTWDDQRFQGEGFVNREIFEPFEGGVDVVSRKTIESSNVSPMDLPKFAKSLKQLPFVKLLYEGKIIGQKGASAKKGSKGARVRADWKTGGSVQQKIREVDDGISWVTRDRREIDNGNFRKKVEQADLFIRRLVEPAVLGSLPPPGVAVHLRNASGPTLPWGFRAFQSNREIHVAQNEPLEVIVHEIGHYVENNLPMGKWADIQLLLHARQGGQQAAGYIYPLKTWKTVEEQRFEGSYPATGAYTSRYYESGHTEVMSMSVQYLADPAKFRTLIEKDPQQAAIILRLLRPTEFNQILGSDPYVNKYLPK